MPLWVLSNLHMNTDLVAGERPKAAVEQVQLQFPLHDVSRVLVAANCMYIVLPHSLFRIDLENPLAVTKIQTTEQITNCWAHPGGLHFIVEAGQYFYLHKSYLKLKALPRFKPLRISHLAFGNDNESATVFLVSENVLYSALLKPHAQENKRDDKYVQLLHKCPHVNAVLCTEKQLQVFCSDILVWDLAEPLKKQQPALVPLENIEGSHFYGNSHYYFLKNGRIVSNDDEITLSSGRLKHRVGAFVATSHHLVFVSREKDSLVIQDKLLSQEAIVVEVDGTLLGLARDEKEGTTWAYTNSAIYEVKLQNESISVWYSYYKLGKYEEALALLRRAEQNEATHFKENVVLAKQGYELLQRGKFGIFEDLTAADYEKQVAGIRVLATLKEPFEKVCLMLLNQLGIAQNVSNMLLVEYLLVKFAHEKANKIRAVVLSSWIVELYLRTLDSGPFFGKNVGDLLDAFLTENHKILDHEIVQQLCAALGRMDKLLLFARLLEKYEIIVDYHIEQGDWKLALRDMTHFYAANTEEAKLYIVRNATQLLLSAPKATTELWLRLDLAFPLLLPAIMAYNDTHKVPVAENACLQFLHKLVFEKGVRNAAVNNYYLLALITHQNAADNTVIIKTIIKVLDLLAEDRKGKLYDPNLLLRLSIRFQKYHPAILLLMRDFKLYDSALQLALENHLTELAELVLTTYGTMETRSKLENETFGTGKKLWMMYARYLIDLVCQGKQIELALGTESSDLKAVLGHLLKLSNKSATLSLKDLLLLLPPDVMIGDFKEEVVDALNEYNSQINQLNAEMKQSTEIKNNLKAQIEHSQTNEAKRKIYTIIEPGEACPMCKKLIIDRGFIVFPNCHHAFHKDCTLRYYLQQKGDYRFKKILQAFKEGLTEKAELDQLMVKECFLCNEGYLNGLDDPLVEEEGTEWVI